MAERGRRLVLLVAASLAGAAPWTAPAAPAVHTVVIEDMQFRPRTLVLRRGDRVAWVNKDLVPHTVTAAGALDSGLIAAGATWATVLQRPGRVDYACTLHPSMKAVLAVEASR